MGIGALVGFFKFVSWLVEDDKPSNNSNNQQTNRYEETTNHYHYYNKNNNTHYNYYYNNVSHRGNRCHSRRKPTTTTTTSLNNVDVKTYNELVEKWKNDMKAYFKIVRNERELWKQNRRRTDITLEGNDEYLDYSISKEHYKYVMNPVSVDDYNKLKKSYNRVKYLLDGLQKVYEHNLNIVSIDHESYEN